MGLQRGSVYSIYHTNVWCGLWPRLIGQPTLTLLCEWANRVTSPIYSFFNHQVINPNIVLYTDGQAL